MYGIVGIMGEVAILISRELYKDAVPLFMIALLYLCIIIIPKRPKKGIKRIITQDVNEIEKENFVEYLNYERQRRKELREQAAELAAAEAEAAETGDSIDVDKEVGEYLNKLEGTDSEGTQQDNK